MIELNETCEGCRFWRMHGAGYCMTQDDSEDDEDWTNPGQCRRFPRFEARDGSDWCGEFEPKAPES